MVQIVPASCKRKQRRIAIENVCLVCGTMNLHDTVKINVPNGKKCRFDTATIVFSYIDTEL